MENYSTRISELRKKANLTQSELGEKLNVTPQAVSKWENGLSEPDVDTFKKMSELFSVSLDYLLNGKEDIPATTSTTIEKPSNATVINSKPQTVTKIISGYCVKCKQPVGPNEYEVVSDGITQKIYCKACNNKRLIIEEQNRIEENKSEVRKGLIWGAVTLVATFVLGIIVMNFLDKFSDFSWWATVVISSYAFGAMVAMLVWDSWLTDVFDFFMRSFTMPGVIFSLDLDGIIWFITVKLGLAILSGILSVVCALIGIVLCAALATVSFPFTLIAANKDINSVF